MLYLSLDNKAAVIFIRVCVCYRVHNIFEIMCDEVYAFFLDVAWHYFLHSVYNQFISHYQPFTFFLANFMPDFPCKGLKF